MGLLLDFKGETSHQICSFVWTDNFWIMSHFQRNLERMLRDLIEHAQKWDLARGGQARMSMRKKKDLKYLLPPMD